MESQTDRDRALARVAEIRATRDEVIDAVAAGTTTLDGVFQRSVDEPTVAAIRILAVLESVPEVGKVRARRLLDAAGIAESDLIGELDGEARRSLLAALAR